MSLPAGDPTRIDRLFLWFGSVLLSVCLFSGIYAPPAFLFIFRITMIFALPAALLYLPFVICYKDAEEGRAWGMVTAGIIVGPMSLLAWAFLVRLGSNQYVNPDGNDIGISLLSAIAFASIIGFLTTVFYVVGLKVILRRST